MHYLEIVAEILVASLLLSGATASFRNRKFLVPIPESRAWRYLLATLTALPGIGMIIATLVPFLAFFAAILSIFVSGSLTAAARVGGARPNWAATIAVMVLSVAVIGLQPLGLRVISLPKADELPFRPVPARVIKTYAAGVGFESVRPGPDGTLYLAANIGLDFTQGEYYRKAFGQIVARRPDGLERVIFTTPIGSTAGVMAIAPDGTIYMSSNGRTPGIWRIARNGTASKLASLPRGAWPNGLDFGPDGQLYAADSNLSQVWRIDPVSGRFTVALRDPLLAARPFVSLAPGANGLHFSGRDMIVSVSDAAKILKYPLAPNGSFGPPVLVASGIPGDDFAIGKDGSLFVTTHPYNTVVRIEPNGRRSIIGDARQRIVGATDASFGTGPTDRDTLYVATDGGAFTAGAKAQGELVALLPFQ